jgi:GNAT superfamily N-acetyltransferase
VTLSAYRSRGFGTALLRWIEEHARQKGCKQIHLDTGLQREDAQRFYKHKEMEMTGYHFAKKVSR